MRRFALLLAGGLLATTPALAQDAVPYSAVRAINLARNTAVQLNGGLSLYRPAQCMFQTARAENPCLIANNSNGYTFRFQGGAPGWPMDNTSPTRETEIQISPDGRTVKQVIYNGVPR
ncbi:MAG: hypothetical protein VKN17_03435 [Cyanobacteriota bacterium]|jgi:hypothetical protein|nr:hypothetical protein [Synechococcus sp. FGCU3]MEB3104815.1 hypothetical protein [Cyanobacteriota bacterium]